MAESRFRLGPVYLSPEIAHREATYDCEFAPLPIG